MLTIICKEIQSVENLGSIARVMANFHCTNLVLVNPKCNPTDYKAEAISKHASKILKNAKIVGDSYLDQFDYLIATTAIFGTDYNIPRSPLTPKQLSEKMIEINALQSKRKIALLFGNEGTGLCNEDIKKADFVITVPADAQYPTMNISHACAIILYELFIAFEGKKSNSHITPISEKEKEILLWRIYQSINKIDWVVDEKKKTQEIVWKRVINKAMLTKREAYALIGFFRKIEGKKK